MMEYLILLFMALVSAAVWAYFEYAYKETGNDLELTIERDLERFSFADECKRACLVVIAYCTILAAIFGASEW